MSDPMKQMEIEDVLSSIRRLVADEVAERAVPQALDAESPSGRLVDSEPKSYASEVAPEPVEKLLLTPAQRVDEGAGQGEEAEGVVDQVAEADEQIGSDEVAAVPPSEEEPAEPQAADDWEEISLEDRIAELEAAVAQSDEDWEPDGSELEHEPEIQFTSLRAAFGEAEGVEPMEAEVEAEVQAADVEPAQEQAVEVETPQEEEPQQVEPEAQDAPELERAEPSEQASESSNMFEDEAAVLDEDMLRQLVADIVREELQGALGQRITRNVRKLVRREINVLLATREFD